MSGSQSPRGLRALAALASLLGLVAGCGDDPPPGPADSSSAAAKPPRSARPKASAAPNASSSAAPTASTDPAPSSSVVTSAAPSTSASAAPAASGSGAPDAGQAPIGWEDFSGPVVKPAFKAGEPVWTVVPVSGSWEAVKLSLLPAISVDDRAVVVELGGKRYLVPGAFASRVPAPAADALAKGDPVMASAHASRVFARVVELGEGKVKVRSKFAGTVEVTELTLGEVVKVDGSASLGAPILVKDGTVERPGYLIHRSPARAWILQGGGRPRAVAPAEIEILAAPKPLAAGDRVRAARLDKMASGVVAKVLDDGLQYEVKWEGGEETTTHTYEWVIPERSPKPKP